MKKDGKYVAVSYVTTGSAAIDAGTVTKYTRPDKDLATTGGADLYYDSIAINASYSQYRDNIVEGRCFTWDFGSYLESKLTTMIPLRF